MSRKHGKLNLGIVIPVLNGYNYLEQCLSSIPEACGDITYKVVVVDNGSDPKSREEFWGRHPDYDVMKFPKALGFPKACNVGADKLDKAQNILFLNSDCIMRPGSIKIMLDTIKSTERMGVVGAKLVFPDTSPMGKPNTIQHAGLNFDSFNRAVHTFIGWSADNPKVNRAGEVDAVTGACLMVRKHLFKQINGFEESYGLGTYEDVDLCLTLSMMGYIIYYEPTAIGEHHVGGSARENKFAYPLNQNYSIFNMRWEQVLRQREWRMWKRL